MWIMVFQRLVQIMVKPCCYGVTMLDIFNMWVGAAAHGEAGVHTVFADIPDKRAECLPHIARVHGARVDTKIDCWAVVIIITVIDW